MEEFKLNEQQPDLLEQYGLNLPVQQRWKEESAAFGHHEHISPARITADLGQKYRLITPYGEMWGELTGKLRYTLSEGGGLPAVGDWIFAECRHQDGAASIHGVLSRHSQISRQAAGSVIKEQIIAANVDVLFLVTALNHDFNLRRLERYLIMALSSGVTPVILLSKADLCEDPARFIRQAESIAPGVNVHAISALEDQGLEQLAPYLSAGTTCALTGSSGCGKSTLLNRLAGQTLQLTQEIREDDSRGRHTTTHRELFPLPGGAVLIDTPGMRELQLWDGGNDGLSGTFADIEELAARCRFRDCRHEREQGCAVREAIEAGELEPSRLESFRKTARELEFQAAKERQREAIRAKGTQKKPARRSSWKSELD
ncbi:ribosome small subunit-dependent GTPase A [Paenibacillus sp. CAA11]|uniref:ribosome small subunit-dependent GTPase A n=1 Tax=Paenibacillus sp. CAA11 TaxID=1532905 RepID=UPI000D35ABDC|nr:ribosome small subunit-dependent GTPase A [Paenibacillus sp. CAA11]AWB43501.1 ribosome small subunit-dependent GTPase A [Paenibacillus sp. CAA11]